MKTFQNTLTIVLLFTLTSASLAGPPQMKSISIGKSFSKMQKGFSGAKKVASKHTKNVTKRMPSVSRGSGSSKKVTLPSARKVTKEMINIGNFKKPQWTKPSKPNIIKPAVVKPVLGKPGFGLPGVPVKPGFGKPKVPGIGKPILPGIGIQPKPGHGHRPHPGHTPLPKPKKKPWIHWDIYPRPICTPPIYVCPPPRVCPPSVISVCPHAEVICDRPAPVDPPVVEEPAFVLDLVVSTELTLVIDGLDGMPGALVLDVHGIGLPVEALGMHEGAVQIRVPTVGLSGPQPGKLYVLNAEMHVVAAIDARLLPNTNQDG